MKRQRTKKLTLAAMMALASGGVGVVAMGARAAQEPTRLGDAGKPASRPAPGAAAPGAGGRVKAGAEVKPGAVDASVEAEARVALAERLCEVAQSTLRGK